jgi:multidrug efflux pump subunit AcrA (membrane-fusion protein)
VKVLRRVLRALLPFAAVAAGAVVLVSLVRTRPEAPRAPQAPRTTPVRVVPARASHHALTVEAQGVVVPARDLVLQPELTGRVVWRHPELVPGGRIRAGETLVRIDPRDFQAAIAQQSAQLENQRVQLQIEERRRAVAEREWELLSRQASRPPASEEGRTLALREPQIRGARASLAAVEAQIRQARLTLSRTTLRAPFDLVVREADVEVGQLVGPASRLAVLVDSARFWVQVSLPLERLAAVRLPAAGSPGAEALVEQRVGAQRVIRRGRVVRLLSDLDPVGRMARALVEIDDPLGPGAGGAAGARPGGPAAQGDDGADGGAPASELPMLLGAFVHVEIAAGEARGLVEVPWTALRDGDTVWVVEDGRLRIRAVDVAWRLRDAVLVSRGLREGEPVIVSPLSAPPEGLAVRILDEQGAAAAGGASADASGAAPAPRAPARGAP